MTGQGSWDTVTCYPHPISGMLKRRKGHIEISFYIILLLIKILQCKDEIVPDII